MCKILKGCIINYGIQHVSQNLGGYVGDSISLSMLVSRLTVVSREAKKKQHACASSGPRDHYSEYLHGWQL